MSVSGRSKAKAMDEAKRFTSDLKPRKHAYKRKPGSKNRSPGLYNITCSVIIMFKTYTKITYVELCDKLKDTYPTVAVKRRIYDVLAVLRGAGLILRVDNTYFWTETKKEETNLFNSLFMNFDD